MFKLLAIRPLPGCAPYIQKCLKTGMMYYFCNDYVIEPNSHISRRSQNVKPLKDDFFSIPTTAYGPVDEQKKDAGLTVSVSAVVGMNGDGKSTLVELMMRLINNCAISYNLRESSDNLRRVKGAKAELYYLIDNTVYRLAEDVKETKTRIWKVAKLNKDDDGNDLMRWEMNPTEIKSVEESFFFTFISNFSHYAYNIYDYKKEWEKSGGEKGDVEKCWLHEIFQNNDGYLTPITIQPYRKDGIIDINDEITLSKQRLLSLFLDAENPSENPYSFRRVNGKDANILKLTEERSSKLQQKAVLAFFDAVSHENRFNDLLDEFDKVNNEIYQATVLYSGNDFFNDYRELIENMLPSRFVEPIKSIVEQDEGFRFFADAVTRWITRQTKNKKKQHDGDILSVIKGYEALYKRNEIYIKVGLYNRNAKTKEQAGDYDLALNYYEKAVTLCETNLGTEHIFTALVYNDIAAAYEHLDRYQEALDYLKKALDIKKRFWGSAHASVALSYHNLARVCKGIGDYQRSLDYYNRALSIRKKVFGENHDEVAESYKSIGSWYYDAGKFNKALEYYLEALDHMDGVDRKHHSEEAALYVLLGWTYFKLGDYEKAYFYFMQAVHVKQNVFGGVSLEAASSIDYLAWSCFIDGHYKQADDFFHGALNARVRLLGEDHPDIATTYDNIAYVHEAMADYDKALEYYFKALSIRKVILGVNHTDIIHTYESIATVYLEKGKTQMAQEYLKIEAGIDVPQVVLKDRVVRNEERTELIHRSRKKDDTVFRRDLETILGNNDVVDKKVIKKQELLNLDEHDYLSSINAAQLGRLDTLYRILKSCNFDRDIVSKSFKDLSLEEKCQHYIVYTFWTILSTNPKYKDAHSKDVWSLREFGPEMEKYIDEIKCGPLSHTRELRQIEHFINEGLQEGGLYGRLGVKSRKAGEIIVELDKLRTYYDGRSFSFDNLPPPIYQWDIVFNKQDNPDCQIELDSFSSGEKQMLNAMGSIIYHLKNLVSSSFDIKYGNVNLILEEIELYYHPEYQRLFFYRMLDMIRRAKLDTVRNINIVFVTHSPFILSDIPKCNVLFLKDGMAKDVMQENTFGANIHSLLKNGFFMPNLPIGEFAYERINKLFSRLNSGELNPYTDLDDIYQEILLVGEPFLRNQLLMLYNSYKGSRLLPKN